MADKPKLGSLQDNRWYPELKSTNKTIESNNVQKPVMTKKHLSLYIGGKSQVKTK